MRKNLLRKQNVVLQGGLQHTRYDLENEERLRRESTFESKGITLVALVVTIVVLLILAGITINLVLRDDGIIPIEVKADNNAESPSLKDIYINFRKIHKIYYIYCTKMP